MAFFVYIIRCIDGTFYTGYTKDVETRAKLHSTGKGARYTKTHPPKEIIYVKPFESRSEAMRHERAVKKLSHKQKEELCATHDKISK